MSHYQDAIEFREAFEFSPWSCHRPGAFELQQRLITEEFIETIEACALYSSAPESTSDALAQNLLKELADLVFVCFQMAAFMGWDLDEAMKRVFESNMSKLGEDGRPVRREDGKILKGALYKPPTLSDLVNKSDA